MTLPAVVLHCPSLGRSLEPIRTHVPDLQIHHGVMLPDGYWANVLGYQAIVRRAIAEGWESVWILEDDCAFTAAFSVARWMDDWAWCRAHGYTLLTGGCVAARQPQAVREGLYAVARFKSTHCAVYHASIYDAILGLTRGPFDKQISKAPGVRAVLTHPFVAVQAPGYSGILGHFKDYMPEYARLEADLTAQVPA